MTYNILFLSMQYIDSMTAHCKLITVISVVTICRGAFLNELSFSFRSRSIFFSPM